MSNYSRQHDFSVKDALPAGDSEKIILGSDVDDEFDELVTVVATKEDSSNKATASGYASLDASALVPVGISGNAVAGGGQVPEATATALGAVELATDAETITGTDTSRVVTPANLLAKLNENAGMLQDLSQIADPGANKLLGWDDTANAAATVSLRAGLAVTEDTGPYMELQLEALTADTSALAADVFVFYDNVDAVEKKITLSNLETSLDVANLTNGVDMSTVTLTAGTGLSYSVGGTDLTADATVDFDPSTLSTISIEDINVAEDGIVVSDNGVAKVVPLDEAGVDVVEFTAAQTLALTDANTLQLLTGATNRDVDIPLNSAVAFKIGTTVMIGSRDTAEVNVSPNTSGVTLTSALGSGVGPSAGDRTVLAGGLAMLIKVATDEWMITGDIS